jgi:predicted porin
MKRKALALACSGIWAGSAAAQSSVTLFGVVDNGVEFANHQPGNGNSVTRLSSGNLSGPRWGIRGTEDLGQGLKASYLLDSGFENDTGRLMYAGRLFGRSAYVGLQGAWGAIYLGRQQNPIFDVAGNFDPMVLAPRYSIVIQDSAFVGRSDNAIKYAGTFGGLGVSAMYSFGADSNTAGGSEVPGANKLGRQYGFNLSYSAGPVSLAAAYDDVNTGTLAVNPDARTRRAMLAATYAFSSAAKAYVGYRWANALDGARLPGTLPGATQRSNLWWTGLAWQVTPAMSLSGAAYYQDFADSGSNAWLFAASADYAFSKRTDVYLNVGYTLNKGTANLGLTASGFGSTLTGANQLGVVAGLRHKF